MHWLASCSVSELDARHAHMGLTRPPPLVPASGTDVFDV